MAPSRPAPIPDIRNEPDETTGSASAGVRIEPAHLHGFDAGPRFAVWWQPHRRSAVGAALCVQPLGEEAARARHAIAAQAWRLAERGWMVLVPDLYGTGDSPGEPADVTLEGWRSDLLRAAMLARQRHDGPNVLWGVRAGALLAADIAVALDQLVDAYVFWQAPLDGQAVVQLAPAGAFSEAMRTDLRELHMQPPPLAGHGTPAAALFLEVNETRSHPGEVSDATCALTEAWLEAGYLATPRSVDAPAFWAPVEVPASSRRPVPALQPLAAFAATEEFLEGLR